jgi:hypothetical protein
MTSFTVYPTFGYRKQNLNLRQVAINWDSYQINSTAGAMTNIYGSLRTNIDSSVVIITYLEFAECVEIS